MAIISNYVFVKQKLRNIFLLRPTYDYVNENNLSLL